MDIPLRLHHLEFSFKFHFSLSQISVFVALRFTFCHSLSLSNLSFSTRFYWSLHHNADKKFFKSESSPITVATGRARRVFLQGLQGVQATMEISARKSPETPPMFSHSSLCSVFLTFEVMKGILTSWSFSFKISDLKCWMVCWVSYWKDVDFLFLYSGICLSVNVNLGHVGLFQFDSPIYKSLFEVGIATIDGPNSLIQELGSVKNINLAIKEERYKDAEPSYYVSPPLPQFCRKQQQQPPALLAQDVSKVVILDADMIICGPIVPWKLSAEKASLLQRIWVKLSKYIGDKYVILFFYALDFTFVCHRSPLSTTATLSLRSLTQKSWVFQLKVWHVALLLTIFYNTKMGWNFASIVFCFEIPN